MYNVPHLSKNNMIKFTEGYARTGPMTLECAIIKMYSLGSVSKWIILLTNHLGGISESVFACPLPAFTISHNFIRK